MSGPAQDSTSLNDYENTPQMLNEYHQKNLVPSESQGASGYKRAPVPPPARSDELFDEGEPFFKIFGLGTSPY